MNEQNKKDLIELEAQIQAEEQRRAALLDPLADTRARLRQAKREREEATYEVGLQAAYPDHEIGVQYDYLRFGDFLVGVRLNRAANTVYFNAVQRAQAKEKIVDRAVLNNYVRSCLAVVEGQTEESARANCDACLTEFDGAALKLANLLTALHAGGTAQRRGK